jgi:RNA polymerase sigma-70 factor (ECF subfamily)
MDTIIGLEDKSASMMKPIVDEIEILDALIQKDENVFENVFHLYSGACLNLSRKILRSDARAHDVVQNVFVQLFEKPERFDPTRGSIKTFLLTQCRSRSIDMIRSETARTKRELTQHDNLALSRNDNISSNTESIILNLSLSDEVKVALNQLGEDEKEVIVLSYYQGLTYRETAAKLNSPEGTVKSRIRSGLKKLKVYLKDLQKEGAN